MSRKRKRYMIGWDDDAQTVYGADEGGRSMFADAMTIAEAKRRVKSMRASYGRRGRSPVIYKLVVVRSKPTPEVTQG